MIILESEKLALRVIDIWLSHQVRFNTLPGLQVCIRKKGKILFSKAYGYTNLENKRILTTGHLFHIASHSKTFTSCAILQLVEQGKLRLHDRALNYIPELKAHKDKRFHQITVRDLLSNRSGIFRDGLDCEFWDLQKPFPSREQLIQEVLSSNLIFSPNEVTKYSNIGFALLGLVMEKITGTSYGEAIGTLILRKLRNTQIRPDYLEGRADAFADGHSRLLLESKRFPLKHAPARALTPATGMCATAEDTSLFFHELLLGKRLLQSELQKELVSLTWPVKNTKTARYGLGLMFDTFEMREFIGHSGGYPGFSTYTAQGVGTDYVISLFLNTNEAILSRLMRSLIQILEKVKLTFTSQEATKAILGGPFMSKWDTLLFAVTKTKSLCFPMGALLQEIFFLESKDGEEYTCPAEGGYDSPGEKITFQKDNKGKILSVTWGAYTFSLEEDFIIKLKNASLFDNEKLGESGFAIDRNP